MGNENWFQRQAQTAAEDLQSMPDWLKKRRDGESQWRDIASAPKDGTRVLLSGDDGHVVIGWWTGRQWLSLYVVPVFPSHWLPLPAPPSRERINNDAKTEE